MPSGALTHSTCRQVGLLWHTGASPPLAQTAARGRDPLGLCDDQARGRLLGRHQHQDAHPQRRQRIRDQRPQMVDLGGARPALQGSDRDGPVRSRQPGPLPAAIDDPGAAAASRGRRQAHAAGVWLRRGAARSCRGSVRQRSGAGDEYVAGRRPRLRDRPGSAGAGPASTIACG